MPTRKDHIKSSVYVMLNDVIEQCFKKMIHFPEEGEELNKIISEATTTINELLFKIDNNVMPVQSPEGKLFCDEISSELKKRSLELLRREQKIGIPIQSKTS